MGSDLTYIIEKRINNVWELFDLNGKLVEHGFKPTESFESGYYFSGKVESLSSLITDTCKFEIPRCYSLYYFLLNWCGVHVNSSDFLLPRLVSADTPDDKSFAYNFLKDVQDEYFIYSFTLKYFLDFDFSQVIVHHYDKTTTPLLDTSYIECINDIIAKMKIVAGDCNTQDVRVLMCYD